MIGNCYHKAVHDAERRRTHMIYGESDSFEELIGKPKELNCKIKATSAMI